MSNLPPNAEFAPEPDSGAAVTGQGADPVSPEVDESVPRTVRRRVPRRVVTPGALRPGAALPVHEPVNQSAPEPVRETAVEYAPEADAETVAEPAPEARPVLMAESAPETRPAREPAIESAPEAEGQPQSAVEPIAPEAEAAVEAAQEVDVEAETRPERELGTQTVETEHAQAAPPAGRIEMPVPSVVRARERAAAAAQNPVVLRTEMLTKSYGQVHAAVEVSLQVHAGSFTGVVGPNGAGKTTVLSMISGLNRPTSGRVTVHDIDVWANGPAAKRVIGSLPDRLRLFDRLSGAQLLYYAGVLQGVKESVVATRATELAHAFGLEPALDRPVSDYSAGMQKKIGLACAMIHAPDVLVLDEPFEAIDPVSASNVTEILEKFVAGGGSVVMSSHSLDLIQRVCDHVAVIVDGSVIAQGTVDEVRGGVSLEERFRHLTESAEPGKGLEWLHGSSDSD